MLRIHFIDFCFQPFDCQLLEKKNKLHTTTTTKNTFPPYLNFLSIFSNPSFPSDFFTCHSGFLDSCQFRLHFMLPCLILTLESSGQSSHLIAQRTLVLKQLKKKKGESTSHVYNFLLDCTPLQLTCSINSWCLLTTPSKCFFCSLILVIPSCFSTRIPFCFSFFTWTTCSLCKRSALESSFARNVNATTRLANWWDVWVNNSDILICK